MKLYRDQGVVLRTHDLGEADRIITFLTRRNGQVRAVAKGIRRTKSRFGARLEPFAMVDAQFYEGRSLDIITEVSTMSSFAGKIGRDYDSYTCASAMAEVTDKLTSQEGLPDEGQYLLLVGALNALSLKAHDPESILASYILRSLANAGWALAIGNCATCGTPGPLHRFDVRAGGMVCESCAPRSAAHPHNETVQLLAALQIGDWDIVDRSGLTARHESAGLVTAYLQWHIERKVKSLDMVGTPLIHL
ncbi:DNA repair protein RecO [Ancrocorticia populi]|uniref:DNA repair protein RecO n=1 Tax=Ancrocorticia populi TaxID=2175228 RepID=A0A2V1KAE1_9ACTO|nr:DNA repair protein RecO [Ancrocorticia populi]PWF26443.1 DNA repair protein RecO [Ancrocorticia populi]